MIKRKMKEFLYHAFVFTFFTYTDLSSIYIPGLSDTYGGRYKFLTILNLKLLILYYGWCTILDTTYILWSAVSKGSKVNRHKFRKNCIRRDYVFSSIVFPISSTVCILYWGIYSIKPNLIQSEVARKYSPVHGFHNHAIHSMPILFTILECFITQHKLSVGFRKGCIGWILFCAAYLSWILWIAYKANLWVYPFMRVMSTASKVLFFSVAFFLEGFLYQVGIKMVNGYWKIGENEECEEAASQKKCKAS